MDMLLEQFKVLFDRPEKVKKLRELILQLAVRGKLVPQDENDEPASVLLERIKEEKERLIKEGKIKKEKPLPEIREDEKPYELPKGWEWVRLGEIGEIFNGNSINAKIKETIYSKVEEGYNYISTKDVGFDSGSIDYNTGFKIPFSENSFKVAKSGAVLVCSEGGSAGKKIGMVEQDICFGNKLYAIEKFVDISSKYIFYLYQSPLFFSLFSEKMTGIIGGISIANFKGITVPLCSVEEQKRIVQKVDSLMVFCDKLEKELEMKVKYNFLSSKSIFNAIGNSSSAQELEETLRFIIENFKDLTLGDDVVKELKNAILQLAVQGKLVAQDPFDEPASVILEKIQQEKERLIREGKIKREKSLSEIKEDEKPFVLPKGWEWVRLSYLLQEIRYGTSKKCSYEQVGIPILRIPNINNLKIDIEDLKFTYLEENEFSELSLKNEDILMIRSNGSTSLVGRVAIISENEEGYGFAGYLIRIRVFKNKIYTRYILNALNSHFVRQQIEIPIRTTSGVKNINSNEISNLYFPLPPVREQIRIVEKVDSLVSLCDELEKRIEKSKKYSEKLLEAILHETFKA